MSFVKIGSLAELPPGSVMEADVAGRTYAVCNSGGTLHALDGVCPHAGGPLGQGMLRKNIVTCPWHGWQFDVTTGRHCLTAHIQARKYAVTVQGDDVFVELP